MGEGTERGEDSIEDNIMEGKRNIQFKLGLAKKLYLGNLKAQRDWGYASDYVRAMWLMLQQEKCDDYVIATGETHSVEDFARLAFKYVGLNYKDYVVVDKRFYRPVEVHKLRGDYKKAQRKLGWKPKVGFEELVKIMVDADLEYFKTHRCV